jgi:hypothetical protein
MVEGSALLLAPLQQQLLWRRCGNSHNGASIANQATITQKRPKSDGDAGRGMYAE